MRSPKVHVVSRILLSSLQTKQPKQIYALQQLLVTDNLSLLSCSFAALPDHEILPKYR